MLWGGERGARVLVHSTRDRVPVTYLVCHINVRTFSSNVMTLLPDGQTLSVDKFF